MRTDISTTDFPGRQRSREFLVGLQARPVANCEASIGKDRGLFIGSSTLDVGRFGRDLSIDSRCR
jgi:hypothetical protein